MHVISKVTIEEFLDDDGHQCTPDPINLYTNNTWFLNLQLWLRYHNGNNNAMAHVYGFEC